jgi:septum formation protein
MPRLVLASGSPFRRELLGRLGIDFIAEDHRCDEESVMTSGLSPVEVSKTLSRAKAESLAEVHPEAFILGSDQVVDLDGEVLGKSGTPEKAIAQLTRLRGREHRLITGLCLRFPDGRCLEAMDIHTMRLRDLSDAAIAEYVRRDDPTDCAGSYKVERLGIALFAAIDGADFTAINGLPLITVSSMLTEAGFRVL